jgi:hypothetical protein
MSVKARYEITVLVGRKIEERIFLADYNEAMTKMDSLEIEFPNKQFEFTDHKLFGGKWKGE